MGLQPSANRHVWTQFSQSRVDPGDVPADKAAPHLHLMLAQVARCHANNSDTAVARANVRRETIFEIETSA